MAMQHRWPAIARLCRNLELDFRCPVHANLYLTPAESQGFSAHFDPHEVFVLQLEGAKTWRVYDTAQDLPIASESQPVNARVLGESRNITLQPGDFLYIPRGCVHEAFTTDSHSLHVTVGINVYRWADLLRHILASASRRHIGLRESIPNGALPDDRSQWKERIQELIEQLADAASRNDVCDEAWHSLGDQFFGQMKMLPGSRFAAGLAAHPIDLQTVMENDAYPLCRVVEDKAEAAIEFPGNRVAGPRRIAPALRYVAGARRFAVGSIPSDLSDKAKIVLTRRLVREGLLTIAPDSNSLPSQNQGVLPNNLDGEIASESIWDDPETAAIRRDAEVNVES
jgi:JmjC domain